MSIEIRDALEEDLPLLWEIRSNPLVLQANYPIARGENIRSWKEALFSKPPKKLKQSKLTSVLFEARVVGYISQYYFTVGGEDVRYCGWDLLPEFWGKGIMPDALKQLFDILFNECDVAKVVADCFPENKRCIRVMEKLGFSSTHVPLLEKIFTAISMGKHYKTVRFQLHVTDWKSGSG
ncbi:MAG: GNAT family N-acetyltransferase [Calditrichia bacterium]